MLQLVFSSKYRQLRCCCRARHYIRTAFVYNVFWDSFVTVPFYRQRASEHEKVAWRTATVLRGRRV